MFAIVHLSQPGASWLQMVCITSTGAIYGAIRYTSGSAAPAAVAHAAYNVTLYAVTFALKVWVTAVLVYCCLVISTAILLTMCFVLK
jgi:hypothetical protein